MLQDGPSEQVRHGSAIRHRMPSETRQKPILFDGPRHESDDLNTGKTLRLIGPLFRTSGRTSQSAIDRKPQRYRSTPNCRPAHLPCRPARLAEWHYRSILADNPQDVGTAKARMELASPRTRGAFVPQYPDVDPGDTMALCGEAAALARLGHTDRKNTRGSALWHHPPIDGTRSWDGGCPARRRGLDARRSASQWKRGAPESRMQIELAGTSHGRLRSLRSATACIPCSERLERVLESVKRHVIGYSIRVCHAAMPCTPAPTYQRTHGPCSSCATLLTKSSSRSVPIPQNDTCFHSHAICWMRLYNLM